MAASTVTWEHKDSKGTLSLGLELRRFRNAGLRKFYGFRGSGLAFANGMKGAVFVEVETPS